MSNGVQTTAEDPRAGGTIFRHTFFYTRLTSTICAVAYDEIQNYSKPARLKSNSRNSSKSKIVKKKKKKGNSFSNGPLKWNEPISS